MARHTIRESETPLDFRPYIDEMLFLAGAGPGLNKSAYGRIIAIRRTLYVAATTEEQCRTIASVVRLLRRWFSSEAIEEAEEPARREEIYAAVAELRRTLTISA